MYKRAGTVSVVCLFAWVFCGCMKHPSLPTAQDRTPGSEASVSEYIRTILRISSENTPASDRALAELHKRRPELADLSQHVANEPGDRKAINNLGQAYFQEKLYFRAYDLYQQIQFAAPEDSRSCLGLAQIWETWGDKDLALLYANRAATLDPTSWEALAAVGRIRLHRRDLDAALAAFLASLQISPDNGYVQASAGYIYMLRDDPESARKHLQRAVDIGGSDLETCNNLGVVLARLGDPDGALRAFMASGDPAVAHNNLGATYLALHDWSGAQAEFRQALAINPEYVKAALNLKEAESHLPRPAAYAVQPFPMAKSGLAELDWQRPAEAAHPRFQPAVPVSLSDYIRKIFLLQDSVASPGQMAAFPARESDAIQSVFSRYPQIPAYAMEPAAPGSGQRNPASPAPPPVGYTTPGTSALTEVPVATRDLHGQPQGVTKQAVPVTPATEKHLSDGGSQSSSDTARYRQIPARTPESPALMAAHQEFHPVARISLSEYIRKIFQLQQYASNVDELAKHMPTDAARLGISRGSRDRVLTSTGSKSAAGVFESYRQVRTSWGTAAFVEVRQRKDSIIAGSAVPSSVEPARTPIAASLGSTGFRKNSRLEVTHTQKAGPGNPWALARSGQRMLEQGQWKQARQYLDQALQIDASIPGARENLGAALAHLGDRDGALRNFTIVGRPAEAFNHLGSIHLSERKWQEARSEFQRALSLEPDCAESRAGLKEAKIHLSSSPAFMIQLFAVKNERNARAAGEMMAREASLIPAIERVQIEDNGVWYRARGGGYETFSSALESAKRLLLAGLIRNYWIVPPDDWSRRGGSD